MTASPRVHATERRYGRAEPRKRGFSLALVWMVERIVARPWLVVVIAMLLAGAALVTTAQHLRIDPSTLEMIAADVPFRRHLSAFAEAFPAFDDPIAAVIEGDVPERVEAAAAALVTALLAD